MYISGAEASRTALSDAAADRASGMWTGHVDPRTTKLYDRCVLAYRSSTTLCSSASVMRAYCSE